MPPNQQENTNNLLVLADQASTGTELPSNNPTASPARENRQISSPVSATGSNGLSDISSITQVSQRTLASTDAPDEIVDSDNEDNLNASVPDDGSINEEQDFAFMSDVCEEAVMDRMLQLCTVGKNEGEEEGQSYQEGDRILLLAEIPEGIEIPGPPKDHVPTPPKLDRGEPPFDQVDNPGNWHDFMFRPRFNAQKKYKGHFLPSGATPVPVAADGTRTVNGWKFHYGPWEYEGEKTFRSGASPEDMFPKSRQGCLDESVLKKLGLTTGRMVKDDALFFYQLLFPICDPKRSGVAKDPRTAFYYDMERFTGTYMKDQGIGGSYGHKMKDVHVPELIVFHGILVRDGVRGGSKGALYRLWDPISSCYDAEVANAMSLSRWRQIKRVMKLNDNTRSPKPGQPFYNPAHKYDLVYRAVVNNCNSITKYAELDQCGDEMTWKFMGYGEGGVVSRIVGKPGVTKGGQVAIAVDRSRCRPRAYVHRHKLHHRPPGFGKQGPNEVRMISEKLGRMLIKEEGDKGIFRELPHMTWDNFFSGDEIMDYLGKKGFGATMTCRRDRLPDLVPKNAFHHEKNPVDKRNKAARFLEPITAVKEFAASGDDLAYTRVHGSLQSTGSTNISSVNAADKNQFYTDEKERGTGDEKRRWYIEYCNLRHLYLGSYGQIDTIDSLISRCNIQYRSRKYWHSALNHGISLGIVTAYDMYKECASGSLCPEWKVERPMTFHQFRDRLSTQMLSYRPRYGWFPGDENFRSTTVLSKEKRKKTYVVPSKRARNTATTVASGGQYCVSMEEVDAAKANKRICGSYEPDLAEHLRSFLTKGCKNGAKCAWCGEKTYSKCNICDVPLHNFPSRGKHIGYACSVEWHNCGNFGLGFKDSKTLGSKNGIKWALPSNAAVKSNKQHIEALLEKL